MSYDDDFGIVVVLVGAGSLLLLACYIKEG